MYYKLINDDTNYDIRDIKKLNEILNKELVIELDISNNQLTQLPDCINDLPNLQYLYCWNNKLTILGKLNLPNLQYLYCNNNKLTTLGQLNLPNLQELYCDNNKLTTLGELNLPNLQYLYCINNNLTTLGQLNLPNLQILGCSSNKLTTLGELNLPNLQRLYCWNNKLTTLGQLNLQILDCKCNNLTTLGQLNLPNLQILDCKCNNLTTLGELNLPNLQQLDCVNNKLTTLGELNLPNLQELYCYNNQLITLPLWLINTRLNYIDYENNAIDNLPLTLIRFINRIQQGNINDLHVYNDSQNIHNSSIQLTVKNSINKLSDKFRIKTFNLKELTNLILEDPVINCKERLIQYMANKEQHSLLLLNFAEILWLVWQEINQFNKEKQLEAKKRLNEEIKEAECMCYTGRCNRLVNCLVGFSDLVEIKIQDSSQIGNIIVIIKERLGDDYTIDKHKEEVKKELLERGYELGTINEWIDYIE
jgi:Leucine-rich repeat (LRR) protein